jgi:hypothetical protein
MVGAVGACVIVAATVWISLSLARPDHSGTVEVQQIEERSWAVEIKDLSTNSTAAVASR